MTGKEPGVTNLSDRPLRSIPPGPNAWRLEAVAARNRPLPDSLPLDARTRGSGNNRQIDENDNGILNRVADRPSSRFLQKQRRMHGSGVLLGSKKVGIFGKIGQWFRKVVS